MNELPLGWTRVPVSEVVIEAQPGFPSGRHNKTGEGVPHLRPMNVSRGGRIDTSTMKFVDRADGQRIARGDVLFNNTNSPELVGKTAYFDRDGDWAYSNHMTRLRPSAAVDGRFLAVQLHWLWMTGFYTSVMNNHVNQASVATKTLLSRVEVVVPPLAEQRRIVAAIEEQLSRLDAAQGTLRIAVGSISGLRARLLNSLNSLQVDHVAVGSLVASDRKIAYGVLQPGKHVPGGVPLVRVGNVEGFRLVGDMKRIDPSIAARYPRTALRGGEVLLTVVGTIGRTAVAPPELAGANVARAVAVIPLAPEVDPRFVALALGSPATASYLTQTAHEVARKTLNLEDVRRFRIPLPPLPEQREVTAGIDTALSQLDSMEAAVNGAGRRGDSLRRSILASAFRGELVPQDPGDEPASVLLDRIAAERAAAPPKPRRRRAPAGR